MKAVLDTNVLVSGIFFSGTPARLLSAWRAGRFTLVVSPLMLDEYRRVALELSAQFPAIDIHPILDLVTIHSEIVEDQPPPSPVCRDPTDDKFIACAARAGAMLVSGDRDLLSVNGALDVSVLTPRGFATALGL